MLHRDTDSHYVEHYLNRYYLLILLIGVLLVPGSAFGQDVTATTITVYWTAPGDDGNFGTASLYEIRYATDSITDANWASALIAPNPNPPSVAGTPEQHTVTGLSPGVTYFVAVKSRDDAGNWSQLSNIVSATTDISLDADDDLVVPTDYSLQQNFPNPFNPITRIQFELPQADNVTLIVFNTLGRRVKTLTAGHLNAGKHMVEWNGTDESGHALASGVYLYRLATENFVKTRKMILLK